MAGADKIPIALMHRQVHPTYRDRLGALVDRELHLQLSEEGADAERLAVLTGYLRAELLQLDVEDVSALPAGEPPPGARAFGVTSMGALLIALGQSAQGLRSVVSVIRDWRGAARGKAAPCDWNSAVTRWSSRRPARPIRNG